jgi:uncharacterized protein with HEPN domain
VKDDHVYLRHILDCLEAIREYTAGGSQSFFSDRKTRKAVIRELQEIAESTQRLSPDLKQRQSSIPWRDIAGFRNVLVHDYLGLNLKRIWNIVERDVPDLERRIRGALDALAKQE